MISRRSAAIATVVALMLVWGSTFAVAKAAVGEIPPMTVNVLRFLIAAAILVPLALARGGLRALPRPLPIAALMWMGLTGVALFHIGFNYALVYGSATQGAIVFALTPAAVTLAAVVALKERPSRRRIAGILLSIAGVVAVVATGQGGAAAPDPWLGAVCMVSAVAAWAAYTVTAKRLAEADQIAVIAWTAVVGVAMLIPLAILELKDRPWPRPSAQAWLAVLFLGIVASAVAFVVYSRVLRELEASLVGALFNLDPIVGVLTSVLFLGETLTKKQAAGAVVAVAGMWLAAGSAEPGKVLPRDAKEEVAR